MMADHTSKRKHDHGVSWRLKIIRHSDRSRICTWRINDFNNRGPSSCNSKGGTSSCSSPQNSDRSVDCRDFEETKCIDRLNEEGLFIDIPVLFQNVTKTRRECSWTKKERTTLLMALANRIWASWLGSCECFYAKTATQFAMNHIGEYCI